MNEYSFLYCRLICISLIGFFSPTWNKLFNWLCSEFVERWCYLVNQHVSTSLHGNHCNQGCAKHQRACLKLMAKLPGTIIAYSFHKYTLQAHLKARTNIIRYLRCKHGLADMYWLPTLLLSWKLNNVQYVG